MSFKILIGSKEIPKEYGIVERHTVKGIIRNQDKVLMILTNKGDYKFPGGGTKKGETLQQTLEREIKEETGFELKSVGEIIGEVIEQDIDKYDASKYFVMKSVYVEGKIDLFNQGKQNLDKYEAEQQFKPHFVTIAEAIKKNVQILEEAAKDMNPWVYRETEVLKKLGR